jgi:hypothetical protein
MNLNEYCEQLRAGGFKAVLGSEKTAWVSHERFSVLRQPTFALDVPSKEEIDRVFKQSRVAMLSFITRPSDELAANSCLYVCSNPEYSLEKLGQSARSHIRRALAEFEIRFLDQLEFLRLGKPAYYDTLARAGLSADHREFEAGFLRPRAARRCLGALKGDRLAAFLLVTEVDDWVSISGYSANEFLPLRPNNGLIHYVLHHHLVEKNFRVVDYGLSSIQADSKAEGLHKFKLKVGFESVPVHRAFVVHPLLRPFVNSISWKLTNRMLKLSPQHPLLKKAEGALRMALQSATDEYAQRRKQLYFFRSRL